MPEPSTAQESQTSKIILMMVMLLALFILFDTNTRMWLGEIVGYVFEPIFGFDHQHIVLTLILTGTFMVAASTIIRAFFTDTVEMAENQNMMKAFNKELRDARMENNLYKIKKLTEQQQTVMKTSMDASTKQLKLMPITMIIIIPVFAWLSVYMGEVSAPIVSVPWSFNVNLHSTIVFLPTWVLLYSMISIPVGQVINRTIRYFQFKKRLDSLDQEFTFEAS